MVSLQSGEVRSVQSTSGDGLRTIAQIDEAVIGPPPTCSTAGIAEALPTSFAWRPMIATPKWRPLPHEPFGGETSMVLLAAFQRTFGTSSNGLPSSGTTSTDSLVTEAGSTSPPLTPAEAVALTGK